VLIGVDEFYAEFRLCQYNRIVFFVEGFAWPRRGGNGSASSLKQLDRPRTGLLEGNRARVPAGMDDRPGRRLVTGPRFPSNDRGFDRFDGPADMIDDHTYLLTLPVKGDSVILPSTA
jgi:hypothetical protein